MNEIAAIQRQLHNGLIFEHLAHRGALRVEQGFCGRGDLHRLGDGAHLELSVDTGALSDADVDIGHARLPETHGRHVQLVMAGLQLAEQEVAEVVGLTLELEVGFDCHQFQLCATDNGAAGIGDVDHQVARDGLGRRGNRKHYQRSK